jgi:hypothetical protein
VQEDAAVLMFGCSLDAYTLFHTAEDAAECAYLYEPTRYDLLARGYDGIVHRVSMLRQDMRVRRRFADVQFELEKEGLLRSARLGAGQLLFIPSVRAVHGYVLDCLRSDPWHLVELSHRPSEAR